MAITVTLNEAPPDELHEALTALRRLGHTPRRSGDGWIARCPAHDDRNASLSLRKGDTKPLVVFCHAGCTREAVFAKLGIPDRKPPGQDDSIIPSAQPTLVETYDYVDEQGELLFQALRYDPKTFRQRRPDGRGGWRYTLGDTRRVLYRLPQILAAAKRGDVIHVVEGEKDVEAIESAGGIATCSPMGAGKWRDEYADALTGSQAVIIIRDKDAPGLKHAQDIAASLLERNIPHIIREARTGKDAADHLSAGHTLDELADYDHDDPPTDEPAEGASKGTRVELRKASDYTRKSIRWLPGYDGLIPIGMLTLLAGLQGFGKSLLTCLIAAEETQAGRTVAIASAEDSPEHIVLPRLEAVGARLDHVRIVTLTVDDNEGELRLPDHVKALRSAILAYQPSILIVDPISAYLGSDINSWRDTDVRRAMRPLGDLALEGALAVVVVAHLNKGDGSSDYLRRVSGNMAFTAAARSGLLFGADPTDPDGEKGSQRVLTLGKSNLAPRNTKARQYRIETKHLPAVPEEQIDEVWAPYLDYMGELDITDKQVLGTQDVGSEAVQDAMDFLREYLGGGPKEKPDVELSARAEGITAKVLREARERVGIKSQRQGFGLPALWSLRASE